MTVLSASNLLFNYFFKNDILKLSDYNKHFLLVEDVKENKEVVRLACENMRENNLLKFFKVDEEDYYVLNRPLESYEQTVVLTAETCTKVAEFLNFVYKSDICNTMNIKNEDVAEALNISLEFLTAKEEQENDE